MAKKTFSIPDQLADWEKMVTNAWANRAELPDLEMYRGPLEQVLEESKELNARLASRRAVKQTETKDRGEKMRTGRFLASKLRSALRAHYGYQSPRLLEYGIKPLQTGKAQPEEPEQPEPAPETPETQAPPQTAEASKPEGPAPTPQDTASQES